MLSFLLKKGGLQALPSATHATGATHTPSESPSVATVATVAVADPQGRKTESPPVGNDNPLPTAPVDEVPDPAEVEERAGIIQANGHAGPWAECFALLCTMRRPVWVTEARWEQILNDAGVFLDRWGKQAAALGWSPVDAFGVSPYAPEVNPGSSGFVLLLEGHPVIELDADTATIDCGRGVTQRFYRSSGGRERSKPLWSLAS